MAALTDRLAAVVARIEARLDAADEPTMVRIHGGRKQVGADYGRCVRWVEVPSLSAYLLARGYGRRADDDDGIPF